jgi:F0F1-type ATP synthase alpha subunit
MTVADQVLSLYSGVRGFLDKIDTSKITDFQHKFLESFKSKHSDIFNEINSTGNFSDESDKKIEEFLADFCQNYS